MGVGDGGRGEGGGYLEPGYPLNKFVRQIELNLMGHSWGDWKVQHSVSSVNSCSEGYYLACTGTAVAAVCPGMFHFQL